MNVNSTSGAFDCNRSDGRWARRALLVLGVAFCCMLLAPVPTMAQDPTLVNPYQRFEAARKSADYPGAVSAGHEALVLLENQYGADSEEVASMLESLALVLLEAGQADEALTNLQRAISIKEQLFGPDHPELVSTLDSMATVQLQRGDHAEAESLLRRILGIEQSLYGERHASVVITWNRLRDLYLTTGNEEEAARVAATLEEITTVTRDFDLGGNAGAESMGNRRYSIDDGFATVRVFYGTNRARTGQDKATQFYGGDRGELEMGYLDVSIPATHKYGELETTNKWSIFTYTLGESALKKKYVLLLDVQPLDQESFEDQLRTHVNESPSRDIFLFVHGYNSSFSDSAMRAAQLAYDLDFDGTPMMYSWPSQGSTTGYTIDEAVVRLSGRRMARFLREVVVEAGADRIHLVAHSMGNRALIEALEYYVAQRDTADIEKTFDQIIFTAPDVDRDYFIDVAESILPLANRITLYTSENDLALKTSALLHGAPRAGLAGNAIVALPGMDTIDMSAVKADSLGHTYFAANEGAIYDLFRLFWRGDPPDRRCGMSESIEGRDGIWRFDVDVCRGGEVLEAGMLLKRFGQSARERVRRRLQSITGDTAESDKEEWTRILDRLEKLIESDEPRAGQ